MRTFIVFALFVLFCGVCYATNSTEVAPEYVINLDLPPDQRWTAVGKIYAADSSAITEYFAVVAKNLPHAVLSVLEKIAAELDNFMGDVGKEIKGMAAALNVPVGPLVILNYSYELRRLGGPHVNITVPDPKACTSIVAEDFNQVIYHARNMDWNLPDNLRHLTFTGVFQKGGKTIYKASCFCGFVGALTGLAMTDKGAASVSIDARELGGSPILDSLEGLFLGASSPPHLLRMVLESASTTQAKTAYDHFVKELTTTRTTAPAYFIVSGDQHGQGAVITKDRNSIADLWQLWVASDKSGSDPRIPDWYRLETNYDHWKPAPSTDNRREYGINFMNSMGRSGLNLNNLFDVMSKWPINNQYTEYTAMMCPKQRTMTTYVRYI